MLQQVSTQGMSVYADTEETKQVSPRGKEKGGAVASFAWHDVRCSYVDKRGEEKEVLHGVSGCMDGGHMLAVIGPSGSGKTCLMDVLAGRKSIGRFSGTRLLDNKPIDEKSLKQRSAYVSQDDVFHPTATVGEAVLFQVNLRLGPDVSPAVKQGKVAVALEEVGLRDKADCYVGGELPGGLHLRGLSGGEKRRLSLCCAIITEPGVLFLDEPTSGLDSFSALVVMHQLKAYCEAGVTVICTIHQPRSAIWALFEKVLVLSCGHELYFGPADAAEQWFTDVLGYPRPHDASAADYLLDVVNTDYGGDTKARQRVAISAMQGEEELRSAAACFRASERFSQAIGKYNPGVSPSAPRPAAASPPSTSIAEGLRLWCWELRVLLGRIVYMYVRNPGNLLARLFVVLWCSAIQCVFFYKTGSKVVNLGGLSLNIAGAAFMSTAMGSMLPFNSITMFLFDRQYFKREAAGGLYSHSAYYVAYSLLEMLLSTVSALLMGSICYPALDYAAFVASWQGNFRRFLVVLVVHTNVGNQVAIFYSLLSPNQDIARAITTGHVMIAICAAGTIVPRPWMNDFGKVLTYFSDIRYALQGLLIDMYTGTSQEGLIELLQVNEPPTVLGNVLCSAVFYVSALVGGYLCLRFLNKEQR